MLDIPMPELAPLRPEELALVSIESWTQAVLFLAGEKLTVVWMNGVAERCLREHGATLSGGRIQLAQKERQKEFEEFLALSGAEALSWLLEIPGDDHALIFRCRMIGNTGYRVLSIFHPTSESTSVPEVGVLFDLTPSESRVLKGLMAGRRADDLAEDLKVSIETVRTHIRRIYNKVGVGSREQLIAKINAYRVP